MKQQRMIVIHSLNPDGSVRVQIDFYPKLAVNETDFNSLPDGRKMLNNACLESGRAMMDMLKKRLEPQKQNV